MQLLPRSSEDVVALIRNAPTNYIEWWVDGYERNPAQRILETFLFLALFFLALKRPRTQRAEAKLSPKEVDELLEEWSPDPLIDPITSPAGSQPASKTPNVVLREKVGPIVITNEGREL